MDFETPGGGEIDHIVMAFHRAKRGSEQTTAGIGMAFAGFDDRFFPDHTFSLNDFVAAQRIFDPPKTRGQLNGIFALIFNMNAVTKSKMHFVVLVERALKVGDHRNFYAPGYLLNHNLFIQKWKYHFRC